MNTFDTVTPALNSDSRYAKDYGVLKLTLHPTGYDWQFVAPPGGTIADSGSDGCSGGSESPPADTTPPRVSSTVPVPGANATGVAPLANITATLSEAMRTDSINGTTFKLMKAGTTTMIGAAVSYDAMAKKRYSTRTPTSSLEPSTRRWSLRGLRTWQATDSTRKAASATYSKRLGPSRSGTR